MRPPLDPPDWLLDAPSPDSADDYGAGPDFDPAPLAAPKLAATADAPAEPLPTFCAADLHGLDRPARRWIVSDWIPEGATTLLGGDGGAGKSLIGIQLAAAVATGNPWLGLPTVQGPALALCAEDDRDELHRRLLDVASARGHGLDALDDLHLIAAAGFDATLFTARDGDAVGAVTARWREIEAHAERIAPKLILLDTAADLFGGNEISRRQTRQFIAALNGLAMSLRCGIVLLSHPSVDAMKNGRGYSGSTAWNASVRSRLLLARPPKAGKDAPEVDPSERILTVEKSNYAGIGATVRLRWESGAFVPVGTPGAFDKIAAESEAEAELLAAVDELTRQGRGHEISPSRGRNFAPVVVERRAGVRSSKRQLEDAMERLIAKGVLQSARVGPKSRPKAVLRRPLDATEGGEA
jgi:RecA-family ATPase